MARLIPDPIVARVRYGVSLRTLSRWTQRPELKLTSPHSTSTIANIATRTSWTIWDRSNAAARCRRQPRSGFLSLRRS